MRMMLRETLFLQTFSFFKIPLIFFLQPALLELTDDRTVMRIKLRHRSRNHLNSMYFGALCIGADCAGGLLAMKLIRERGGKYSMVFKDIKGEFLKRVEGDAHFICNDGAVVRELMDRAEKSGQRENASVNIDIVVPSKGDEVAAKFALTLSIKKKSAY